jgi:MFS family permease
MMTILRPVLIAENMGRRGFGQVAGMIQVPSLIGSALGPMVGGLLLQTSGVAMIGTVAGACGVVAIFTAWRIVVAASLVET